MNSAAVRHFPPVVLRSGEKALWNRIEKKPLANRPEERVRLRYLDYLTLECGWSATRIATEPLVEGRGGRSHLRADLICYDKQFRPRMLIECKAESVPIDQRAAEQIALYNRSVQAPVLCITNGVEDFWHEIRDGRIASLNKPPVHSTTGPAGFRRTLEYWQQRGFAGKNPVTEHGSTKSAWIVDALQHFWAEKRPWTTGYLDIDLHMAELPFNHYYRLGGALGENRIAMSFMAGTEGDTFLTAIYNRDGENSGVLVVNLNRVAEKSTSSASLFTGSSEKRLDAASRLPFDFTDDPSPLISSLPERLHDFFERNT